MRRADTPGVVTTLSLLRHLAAANAIVTIGSGGTVTVRASIGTLPPWVRAATLALKPDLLARLTPDAVHAAFDLPATFPLDPACALYLAWLDAERDAFDPEAADLYCERAAIREHGGHEPGWLAELRAVEDVLEERGFSLSHVGWVGVEDATTNMIFSPDGRSHAAADEPR